MPRKIGPAAVPVADAADSSSDEETAPNQTAGGVEGSNDLSSPNNQQKSDADSESDDEEQEGAGSQRVDGAGRQRVEGDRPPPKSKNDNKKKARKPLPERKKYAPEDTEQTTAIRQHFARIPPLAELCVLLYKEDAAHDLAETDPVQFVLSPSAEWRVFMGMFSKADGRKAFLTNIMAITPEQLARCTKVETDAARAKYFIKITKRRMRAGTPTVEENCDEHEIPTDINAISKSLFLSILFELNLMAFAQAAIKEAAAVWCVSDPEVDNERRAAGEAYEAASQELAKARNEVGLKPAREEERERERKRRRTQYPGISKTKRSKPNQGKKKHADGDTDTEQEIEKNEALSPEQKSALRALTDRYIEAGAALNKIASKQIPYWQLSMSDFTKALKSVDTCHCKIYQMRECTLPTNRIVDLWVEVAAFVADPTKITGDKVAMYQERLAFLRSTELVCPSSRFMAGMRLVKLAQYVFPMMYGKSFASNEDAWAEYAEHAAARVDASKRAIDVEEGKRLDEEERRRRKEEAQRKREATKQHNQAIISFVNATRNVGAGGQAEGQQEPRPRTKRLATRVAAFEGDPSAGVVARSQEHAVEKAGSSSQMPPGAGSLFIGGDGTMVQSQKTFEGLINAVGSAVTTGVTSALNPVLSKVAENTGVMTNAYVKSQENDAVRARAEVMREENEAKRLRLQEDSMRLQAMTQEQNMRFMTRMMDMFEARSNPRTGGSSTSEKVSEWQRGAEDARREDERREQDEVRRRVQEQAEREEMVSDDTTKSASEAQQHAARVEKETEREEEVAADGNGKTASSAQQRTTRVEKEVEQEEDVEMEVEVQGGDGKTTSAGKAAAQQHTTRAEEEAEQEEDVEEVEVQGGDGKTTSAGKAAAQQHTTRVEKEAEQEEDVEEVEVEGGDGKATSAGKAAAQQHTTRVEKEVEQEEDVEEVEVEGGDGKATSAGKAAAQQHTTRAEKETEQEEDVEEVEVEGGDGKATSAGSGESGAVAEGVTEGADSPVAPGGTGLKGDGNKREREEHNGEGEGREPPSKSPPGKRNKQAPDQLAGEGAAAVGNDTGDQNPAKGSTPSPTALDQKKQRKRKPGKK